MMIQKIFFRPERCMLCLSCVLACQIHSLGISDVRQISRNRQPIRRIFTSFVRGTPWVWTCQHCLSAPCVEACVSGSLRYQEREKVVIHRPETCVGCGSCILVCPFGALGFDEKEGRVEKCSLCLEDGFPRCVEACQTQALVYQDANLFARNKKKRSLVEVKLPTSAYRRHRAGLPEDVKTITGSATSPRGIQPTCP
jgi:carbon-monoxide dehydrogenase iron sulfur subunit